jgi:ParB family chromosome partitioning protein
MNQPAKPAPLGRGLSALFGDADTSYLAKTEIPLPPEKRGATFVPIQWIRPGAFQPRRNFDNDAMKELVESVRIHGVLQPLLVRPVKDKKDQLELVAGERRWRAAQMAEQHEVPVVIRPISDRQALEFGIIENVQRQDLSPLEEAEGYHRLMKEFLHTQEDLARTVGKSRAYIGNLVRLLALPDEVKKLIDNGKLSAGHARVLVSAKDPLALALEIVRLGLSVRQAEELAKQTIETRQVHKKKNAADANIMALEKDLTRSTGLRVSINSRGAHGTLTLHYQSNEQLDDVIKKLKG